MTVDANKAVVQRFYDEVVSSGNLDLLDELAHEDMTDHAALANGWGPGREGFRLHVNTVRTIVPDFEARITELIGEGDVVVAYWLATGTAKETFLGVEPTGRPFAANAISRLRFADGRIAEYQVMPGPAADAELDS